MTIKHDIMPLESMIPAIAGTIFGINMQGVNDRRQLEQQRKLNALQIAGSKELTAYNIEQQLKLWNATNYKAQVDQLKKAGLNPALLYGMSGGGGATTNINAGQVSGGNAPVGGGEILGSIGMALQAAMQKAQIENIQADTAVKQATVPKTQAETANLAQGVANMKAQEVLTRIDTELRQVQASVARQTIVEQMHIIENQAMKGQAEITQLQLSNQLDFSQMQDKIKLLRAQAVGALIENSLKSVQIEKTHTEIDKLSNDMLLGWETLENEQQRTRIQQFLAEFQAGHPGLMNVLGGAIQRLADHISKPLKGQTVPNK